MVSTVYRTTTTTNEGGTTKTTTTTSPNNPATRAPVSSGPTSSSHNTTRVSPFPFQSGNISGSANYVNVYSTPKDYAQSAYANVPINRSDLQAPITAQLQKEQQAQQLQNQSDATKTSSGGKLSSEFGMSRSEYMKRHANDVEQKPVIGYEITTKDSAGNVISGYSISKAEYDRNPQKYEQNFPIQETNASGIVTITQTGAFTPTTTSTSQLLKEQASISGEGFQKSVEGGVQLGALLSGPAGIIPGGIGGGLFYAIEKGYSNIASPLYDATKININPRLDLATRYTLTPQTVNIEPLNMHINIFPGKTGEGIGYGGTPGGPNVIPRSDTSGNTIHEGISFSEVVGFIGASKLTTDITKTVKVSEVRVPAEEGGNTLVYRGLSLERGPSAQPIVGFSGGKMVFGTPKVDIDMAGMRGYTPVTPLETKIVRENIKIPENEFLMQSKALEVMKITEHTPSAFIQESFGRQTRSLSPAGVDVALKYFKGDKSVEELYGSFADVPQMPKGEVATKLGVPERVPADIDVKYKLGGEATALKAQGLMSKLREAGEDVKISEERPTLIESRNSITGEYRHAIDIHSNEISPTELSSQSGGEGGFGYRYGQKPKIIEDIPTMPLSEQGLRKGASSVSLWNPKAFKEAQKSYFERIGSKEIPQEKYVSPEPHRMKDIGDFYSREKTLLISRKMQGKDITEPTKALETFKDLSGLEIKDIPSTVKISLLENSGSYRSPSSSGKPSYKPYYTSLGDLKYQPTSPSITASTYSVKPSISPSISTYTYKSPSLNKASISPSPPSFGSISSSPISNSITSKQVFGGSSSVSLTGSSTSISPIYGDYPYSPGIRPPPEGSGIGLPPSGGGLGGGGGGGEYWRKPTRTKRIKRPIRDAASYLGLNIMGRKKRK